jgi:hypothetical protein
MQTSSSAGTWMHMLLQILRVLAIVCVVAAFIGWVGNLARGRTTVRASFYDDHGLKPLPAALVAVGGVVTIALVVTLITT